MVSRIHHGLGMIKFNQKYRVLGIMLVCIIQCFLVTIIGSFVESYFLMVTEKTLWFLFMDRVQLPQGYSATTVCFLPLSPQKFSQTTFFFTEQLIFLGMLFENRHRCLVDWIFGQRTFFSIIKLVFWGKHEFYLFWYSAFFEDCKLFK